MVLRLFSRSKRDTPKAAPAPAAGFSERSEPAELERAIREASNARERAALVSLLSDTQRLQTLMSVEGCLGLCADRLVELNSTQAVTAGLTDSTQTVELALLTHNADLRSTLIEGLRQEDDLIALEHASRSKNKLCNRAARAQLERLRGARQSAAEAAERAAELARSAAALDDDAHQMARYEALAKQHQEWAIKHAAASDDLAEFAEHAPALAALPTAPEHKAPAQQDNGPDFHALAQRFATLSDQLRSGQPAAPLAPTMTQAIDDWKKAIGDATPDAASIDTVSDSVTLFEQLRGFEAVLEQHSDTVNELIGANDAFDAAAIAQASLDKLPLVWTQHEAQQEQSKSLQSFSKQLRYPTGVARPPLVEKLNARLQVLKEINAACNERRTNLEARFAKQVSQLDQALQSGELKRAEAARAEARALQDALPAATAGSTRKRFTALLRKMHQLRDWQHFATDPKREELCAQMTALADQPKSPDEQADLVKQLRSQWNELGGKGPKEIAERFDEAAARAFEPCRLHYAQLADARSANLATRQTLLTQLETFVETNDWANADLAGARNILNSARAEWREAFPVERSANRALEKRFKAVTDALYEHLQVGWKENLSAKEALVVSAEALVESDAPLGERLEAAKRLQQQWKSAGPAPRGPDQKLWKRFRAACDSLFGARDTERNQQKAEHAATQEAASARLDTFSTWLADTQPSALTKADLSALKADLEPFDALDRGLQKRARDLEDQFSAKLKEKASAQKRNDLMQLADFDAAAARSERSGEPIPAEVLDHDPVFASRSPASDTAHLDLVLEAESHAGLDSPAADAQRRLELQVEWLNAGMNSAARKAASPMELARRWCALQGADVSDELRERLFAAAKALL